MVQQVVMDVIETIMSVVSLEFIEKLAIILGLLLFTRLFILNMVKGALRRLVGAGVIDSFTFTKIYRLTELVFYLPLLAFSIYFLTGSTFLFIVMIVTLFAVLTASWDIISNVVSYYVIVFSRMVSQGDYIILPSGLKGRVREINPFYVTIEDEAGVYAVPNSLLVREGRLQLDKSVFRLIIRVWGLQEAPLTGTTVTILVEKIRDVIDRAIVHAMTGRIGYPSYREEVEHMIPSREKLDVFIDEISEDSITLWTELVLDNKKGNMATVSKIVQEVASQLKEQGFSYSVTVERPEGYEQRWVSLG